MVKRSDNLKKTSDPNSRNGTPQRFLPNHAVLQEIASIDPQLKELMQRMQVMQYASLDKRLIDSPDPRLLFEKVVPANLDQFAIVMRAALPETNPNVDELTLGFVNRAISQPSEHWFLVHFVNELPFGVLLLDRTMKHDEFSISFIGLAKEYRGRGLGSSIMKFALLQAKNAGARSATAIVNSANESCLRMCRSIGMQSLY